ncbi:LuxR C-terminal-related transcriptional regulator [Nocardia sp. NPDC004168]|uniref:helix-turn-helix transcriptional regulator n=1 Tax=Nocardia sp. NPDC004168 TaxID=3154452 RepID=UPI0033BC32CF
MTVVGPGGIGKTSLAVEAVIRLRRDARRAIHWVGLGRVSAGASVEEEVARAVAGPEFSPLPPWEMIVNQFSCVGPTVRALRPVLVLDNCEHVLDAAAEFVVQILDAMPGVAILATSREPIGWVDERLVVVPPLTAPQASTLFTDRAALTGRPVRLPEDRALVERICRRVENNPLFVRLAAARMFYEPLQAILDQLADSGVSSWIQWSHGPVAGAEPRHRAIRDVIGWSYRLCPDDERLLLERLSVFAPGDFRNADPDNVFETGMDLEAITAVCADEPGAGGDVELRREDIGELIDRLGDRSLINVRVGPTGTRYSLPQSAALFAAEHLRRRSAPGPDEPARVVERHRRYYQDKLLRATPGYCTPEEDRWIAWGRADWDNVVLAIERSITDPEYATEGLMMTLSPISQRVSLLRGSLREIQRLIERALEATRDPSAQPNELRLAAMAAVGVLSFSQGQRDSGERMLTTCVDACLALGEREGWRDRMMVDLGLPPAVDMLWGTELAMIQGDLRALVVLARAREKFTAIGDDVGAMLCERVEASAAGVLADEDQALSITHRYLDSVTGRSDWLRTSALFAWANACARHGRLNESLMASRKALQLATSRADELDMVWAVHVRLWALARLIEQLIAEPKADRARINGTAVHVARLLGGAETQRSHLHLNFDTLRPVHAENEHAIAVVKKVLGERRFAAARREGVALVPERHEVHRLALGTLGEEPGPAVSLSPVHDAETGKRWEKLSATEVQVAILAAAGWTNAVIADRRGNSVKTVAAHMNAILNKLAVPTRTAIITHMPQDLAEQVSLEATRRKGG